MKLPTVTIVREGRPVRINESDYDPDTHTLYDSDSEDVEPDSDGPVGASEVTYDYSQNGYWSIYADGEEVDSGRGREALGAALKALGVPLEDD